MPCGDHPRFFQTDPTGKWLLVTSPFIILVYRIILSTTSFFSFSVHPRVVERLNGQRRFADEHPLVAIAAFHLPSPHFVVVLLLRSLPFIIFHRLLSRFLC